MALIFLLRGFIFSSRVVIGGMSTCMQQLLVAYVKVLLGGI